MFRLVIKLIKLETQKLLFILNVMYESLNEHLKDNSNCNQLELQIIYIYFIENKLNQER